MLKIERIHFLSRAEMLKPLRCFVRELGEKQACSEESLNCMVMAINEACMNVIQHAYHGKQDEEIIIEFWKDKDELVVKIFDFADSADIKSIKSRDLEDIRPGGLGVHIIQNVMDCVEYKHSSDEKGNVLEMRKKLNTTVD